MLHNSKCDRIHLASSLKMCFMTWENSNISLLHFIVVCRYCNLKMCQLCSEQVYWYHSSKSFVFKLMQIFKVYFLDITLLHTYKTTIQYKHNFFVCLFLTVPHGMWDLCSTTRDWTNDPWTGLGNQNISLLWFVSQLVMCPKFTSWGNPYT